MTQRATKNTAKKKIKIVEGNLLNATESIICHQVNVHGVMGAGIAAQIAMKYPAVDAMYSALCQEAESNDALDKLIGTIQYCNTENGKIIANVFSQNPWNDKHRTNITNYEAVEKCFKLLAQTEKSVAIPYNYGCGIAGGDWDMVYEIICKAFEGHEDMVTLYRYVPK